MLRLPEALDDQTLIADLSDSVASPDTPPTGLADETMSAGPSVGPQPGTVWGDFEFGKLLGQGGMGSVYLGRQRSLDRPVAIKVLPVHLSANEGFRKRFELEAKAVAKMSSPHVIQVYYAGEHSGHHFFAMEYVEGSDLSQRLKDGMRPGPRDALDLVLQAVKGLAAAGEQDIVHRDIKPGNMMVTDDGHLKLMDFGLVKLASASHSLTMTGTVMGTVSYFAPEQGRGEECDQRADLYAIGVVFYELLTGVLPFTGSDATSIIYQHIHVDPRPPAEINPAVSEDYQAVILKCLQKDPGARYQDAASLLSDLEHLRQGRQPITAFQDPEALRTGATLIKTGGFKQERKGRGALLVVLLVLLAGLGGGGWYAYDAGLLDKYLAKPGTESSGSQGGHVVTGGPATAGGPTTRSDTGSKASHSTVPERPLAASPIDERWLADVNAMLLAKDLDGVESRLAALDNTAIADERVQGIQKALLQAKAVHAAETADAAIADGDLRAAAVSVNALEALDAAFEGLASLRARLQASEALRTDITAVKKLLADGDVDAAVAKVDAVKQQAGLPTADVELIANLKKQAHAVQGLLRSAKDALQRDDLATARQSYLTAIGTFENSAANQGLTCVTLCKQFNDSLDAGELDKAAATLKELENLAMVSEDLLTSRRQRLQVTRIVVDAKQTLERNDFAQVEQHLAVLAKLAPDSAALKDLSQQLAVRQHVQVFDQALQSQDLTAATAALAKLETLDGGGAAFKQAQERLQKSRLKEKAKAEALSQALALVDKAIAAERPDAVAIKKQLQALMQTHGEQAAVKQRQQALQHRLREIALVAMLKALDKAVLAGDKAGLESLVADAAHRQALSGLIGQQDLSFAHKATAFSHQSDATQVAVQLQTAMRAVPAVTLGYHYTCKLVKDAWQVVSVVKQEAE